MNLVGKIITILILLLSVCFLMIGIMVNASHQNWKELAIANKAKVEEYAANRDRILGETAKKDNIIESEKVARMLRIQQLESQLQLARKEFEQANSDLNAQRQKAAESFNVVQESEERLAEQDKLIDSLQTQLRTLTEDVAAQRAKVVALTGNVFELNSTIRNLETMRDNLAAVSSAQRKVMMANGLTISDTTDHIPRALDGLVTAINDNEIVVNLGLDDGLRRGHTVDLFRGEQFVGTAKVYDAQANRSAARLDKALSSLPAQVNDRVTTKWVLDQK